MVVAVAGGVAGAVLGPGIRIAEAGCHGSGGGGGHGGGGHGGGGHSSRGSACEEPSDVVGFRHCRSFAAWSLHFPHLIIEAGAAVRRFGTLLDSQTGSVAHGGESFSYRVVQTAGSRPLDTAVTSMLRAGFGLAHGLYTGLEVDLGGLAQSPRASTEMMSTGVFGTPDVEPRRGLLVDSFGVVGLHGAIGSGGLGVELAGGLRTVSYSFHSSYHDCAQSTSITAFAPAAEARARGELWISPWLTAGITVGTSVLERNAWMGGVYLGVHSRAFGGDR
jgi:hypothetical protein